MKSRFFLNVFDYETKKCIAAEVALEKNTLINKAKSLNLPSGSLVCIEKIGEKLAKREMFTIEDSNFITQLQDYLKLI